MELDYQHEKFMNAVYALISPADHKTRLKAAAQSFFVLTSDNFKKYPDLQKKYQDIYEKLTAIKADEEKGYISSTVDAMSIEEAGQAADMIFELFMGIAQVHYKT